MVRDTVYMEADTQAGGTSKIQLKDMSQARILDKVKDNGYKPQQSQADYGTVTKLT